jgi:hypothetical protein
MKSITRLSLALIMFSLFSISYLVTSVSTQDGSQSEQKHLSESTGEQYTPPPVDDSFANHEIEIAKPKPNQQ